MNNKIICSVNSDGSIEVTFAFDTPEPLTPVQQVDALKVIADETKDGLVLEDPPETVPVIGVPAINLDGNCKIILQCFNSVLPLSCVSNL